EHHITDVNQLYDALYNKAGVNGLFTALSGKSVNSPFTPALLYRASYN
ncbi:hypothetical protein PSZ65_23890, partial [Shigella sonnei]|nr:hypothetical protein [Shigella sonnei]